jgi:hypothetical protein
LQREAAVDAPAALADLDDMADQARITIQQTWEVSLDALAARINPSDNV